jgi:hypothetical protein
MKAKLVDSMPTGSGWIYEIKFDGYRALALRGGSETRILSRNQKDLGDKFPKVKDSIVSLDLQDVIIDGEIVALDERGRSSFQLLQGFDIGTGATSNRFLRLRLAPAQRQRSSTFTNRRTEGRNSRFQSGSRTSFRKSTGCPEKSLYFGSSVAISCCFWMVWMKSRP